MTSEGIAGKKGLVREDLSRVRVDPASKSYRKLVLRDGKVIGAILIGNVERAGVYTGMICTQVDVRAVRGLLLSEHFDLGKLADAMLKKQSPA